MYQSFLLRTRASCRVPRAAPSITQPSRRGAPQTSLRFATGSASSWEEQQRRAVDYIAHNAPRAAISASGRWSPGVLAFVSRRANSTRPSPRLLDGRETEPSRVSRHLESSWTPLHSLIPEAPSTCRPARGRHLAPCWSRVSHVPHRICALLGLMP